jgi:hypothetical protein
MRTQEKNTPIERDVDPYLAAHTAQKFAAQEARERWRARLDMPEYFESDDHDFPEVTWEQTDDYLSAARTRLRDGWVDPAVLEGLRVGLDERRAEWLKERERCRREVPMLTKLDEPVPDDLRAKAEEPDHFPLYEQMRTAMVARQLEALSRLR